LEQFFEINGQIRINTNDEEDSLKSCVINIVDNSSLYWEKKEIQKNQLHISLWGEIYNLSDEKIFIDWIINKTRNFHIRSGIIEIIVDEKEMKFFMIYNSLSQKWDISHKSF
jgi:hypothetical protein